MSARMVRIKKEMRALFGPWCAVVIAGALPVIMPHSYTAVRVMPAGLAESLSFLSFFFGVPLLATLSLGDEFRYGTLSLWLARPCPPRWFPGSSCFPSPGRTRALHLRLLRLPMSSSRWLRRLFAL